MEVREWTQGRGERVWLWGRQSEEGGEELMEWRKGWQLLQEVRERVVLAEERWSARWLL